MDEPTASNTTPGLRAGSRFGHYRLRRLLGRGGFGEVYEAEDTMMERAVALKLLAAPYSQNEVFRQRLYREARNAGKLHEPHVVPIHHCGEIDGQLYIDMRLVEGTDLQKVLARDGRLSPARAVAIVRQIAAALDAAHSVHMVHRDIKPANILLTRDDFACLVDFGLANAATDASLTSTGTTIGTFAYMAPERFSNTDVSHRADIYALACVLYECLTGAPPYPTGDLPALINAHLTAPVPRPSQSRPEIPAGLDDVIAVGMAKDPNNRFDSASDLAVAAHDALRQSGQRQADAIVASTEAAHRLDHRQAAATKKPPTGAPVKTPRPSTKQTASPAGTPSTKSSGPSTKTPRPPTKPTPPAPRHSLRRIVIGVALAALLLLGTLAVSRTVIRSYYYVTAYNGAVSIMQGIQFSVLGVPLYQPYSQGCLNSLNQLSVIRYGEAGASRGCQLMKPSDLAESARAQVAAGLPVGTLEQADAQLRRLATESLLPLCALSRGSEPIWSPPATAPASESGATPTVTAINPPPPQPGTDCRAPE